MICIENLSSELQESLTLETSWCRKGNKVEANTEKELEVVGVTDIRHMMKIKTKATKLVKKELSTPAQKVSKQSLPNVSELRMTVTQGRSVKARLLWSLNIVAPHMYFLFQLQLAVLAYQVHSQLFS